ncbi:hypothetical protein [Actinoplanes sp. CA-252034]|uniref:hypothetical protein n=1 Tax=Actinoplanes sp. CA-252034 TaxID=3239906 RepID=UPI003D9528D1
MRTYRYRLLRTSWGIWINLTARAEAGELPGGVVVSPGLPVRLACVGSAATLLEGEREELRRGLAAVAAGLPGPLTVIVSDVALVEVDFQPEGLAVAMCRWAEEEFGLTPRVIGESYDRATNRYVFDWGAGDG